MRAKAFVVACLFAVSAFAQTSPKEPAKLLWLGWGDDIFAQAKREHRFVLLDLEAVWCHWCHVMDETTYKDPKVIGLLRSKYLTVKVDQDSRPDLSNRYEDYGWPATVVFDENGQEIIKRQGYLAPEEFASILQAIIDDPSPGPSVQPETKLAFPTNPLIPDKLRLDLEADYLAGYDSKEGSWGTDQKFLDWDSVEYAMALAKRGDAQKEKMARQTLTAQLHLLDPVWGGVYQYSTDAVWTKPHFEKIMSMQAEDLRIYSDAYAQFHEQSYLNAAVAIHKFLTTFLMSPQGVFYVSQDADVVEGKHSGEYFKLDDAGRRKQGVPRVDKHIYARENGWAITGIATLYGATGEQKYLDEAVRSTKWVMRNRALPGGGFSHDAKDASGPYLGDSIAMTRAFVVLYGATGDRQLLVNAEHAMSYIDHNFRNADGGGYLTAKIPTDRAYKPHPQRDENVMVARNANLLFYFTADPAYQQMRDQAMRYLAAPPIAKRLPVASVLLVDYEAVRPPLHLTVVGSKSDPAAQELFRAALRYPSGYKRLEWWDKKEGKLPNPDVQYPDLSKAAAFICTERACSQPIFKPDDVAAKVDRLLAAQGRETSAIEPEVLASGR